MTIHFELRFEDLFALQKHVIQYSFTHHVKRMYFKWITSILLAILLLLSVNITITTFLISLIIAALYFLIAPNLYNTFAFWKYKKQMETKDYTPILGSCKMELLETGISRIMNGKETFFEWDRFEKLGEDEEYYFLYESDLNALIIPKQTGNTDEISSFHQLIGQNVKQFKGEKN